MSTIGELWAEVEGMDTRTLNAQWFRRMQAATLQSDIERQQLIQALQTIANLAVAPMVDMADPPEDQARSWSHIAAFAWNMASAALTKHGR